MGIMIGTLVYAGSDYVNQGFDLVGYGWQFVNSCLYVCGTFWNKKYQTQLQVDNEQTAEGNALIAQSWTLLWALCWASVSGEIFQTRTILLNLEPNYMAILLLTGLGGFAISAAYNHCYALAAPTSVVVAANINRAIAVAVGVVLFRTQLRLTQMVGLIWCFLSGLLYSVASKSEPDEPSVVLDFLGLGLGS